MKILQEFFKAIFFLEYRFCSFSNSLQYSFYKSELYWIKFKLSNIETAEVKNIWGDDDITLEEISARIYVKDKGEIVLANLSHDVKKYPLKVIINEVGGYSFNGFYDYGQVFFVMFKCWQKL